MDGGIDVDMVHRYADLAGVQELGESNSLRGEVGISGRRHDCRTLASQLQDGRRQMLRRSAGDDSGDFGTSGVEDVIKIILQDAAHLLRSSTDGRNGSRIEVFGNEVEYEVLCGNRKVRRFHDDSASGCNCSDNWLEKQKNGEIPGANDEGKAQRLISNSGLGQSAEDETGIGFLVGIPFLQVLDVIENIRFQTS